MVVVGGGVIGLELGSVWGRLGAKVTVVEYLDKILGGMDGEVSKQFQRMLAKQGMEFKLGAKVTGVKKIRPRAPVTFEPARAVTPRRSTPTSCWSPPAASPTPKASAWKTPAWCSTSAAGCDRRSLPDQCAGIYAIGDVIAGPMLAHKAEDEGVALAEIMAGQAGHVNYDVIPGVVYTQPEVASVGKTEEELKKATASSTSPASSRSRPTAGRGRCWRRTASSRCWPMPRPTGCWASTSSASAPAR
jgi:dihydrolipoamide dehydrogenase